MKLIIFHFLFWISGAACAQSGNGFRLGSVTVEDLLLKIYEKDTSARALVLDEFGEAYIDNDGENNLILEYKIKIKILKNSGMEEANFRIPLYKSSTTSKQLIRSVSATVYNFRNNVITTSVLDKRSIFTTSLSDRFDEVSFALPDVSVGSVIEVFYMLESPYIFNFWPWKFQSHLPKVRSEFWARIPGNYVYNIALKGFLKLHSNESSIVKECFTPGRQMQAECVLYKYLMKDIPAFIEEDYMTAKSNFIAAIDYELSEIKHFDGRIVKFTKTWKDVDTEMSIDENFGREIKKSKGIFDRIIPKVIGTETDSEKMGQLVYNHVKNWYRWNGNFGKFAASDAKKAHETRTGNSGDINLALVGALQAAGLNADPVILATRDYGLPHQLFPVITEFNYVVAHVALGNKYVLLDATEPLLPFGMLPERCLNGKGRLISKKVEESNWVDIKPSEKRSKRTTLELNLENNVFKGTMTTISSGYEAFEKRKRILSEESEQEYLDKVRKNMHQFTFSDYKVENLTDLSLPLIETVSVESELDTQDPNRLYMNPFFFDRVTSNPFKSSQRLYPVDFGAPRESTFLFSLTYPAQYEVDETPQGTALTLPANGGRFLLNVGVFNGKISITSILNLSKIVYTSNEYHALKELFERIVQSHNSQFVFIRKQ
jgi:hypothetical protein